MSQVLLLWAPGPQKQAGRAPSQTALLCPQIQQWEQNLEKFHVDLFRMRCYLASLQGGELPNPKSLLAAASRPSKLALSRLGILSVSSFHALVSGWVGFDAQLPVLDPRPPELISA